MTTASNESIWNSGESNRGKDSKGLCEPGLIPQSSSTLLSRVLMRKAERPTSCAPPSTVIFTSPTSKVLGMKIMSHVGDDFGTDWWTSENVRTPFCFLNYFLQYGTISSYG